jgi:hypothetical protein
MYRKLSEGVLIVSADQKRIKMFNSLLKNTKTIKLIYWEKIR